MRTVIVSGGSIDDAFACDFLKKLQTEGGVRTIAADHGLEFFYRNRLLPDCIVGDFDSTDPAIVTYYRDLGTVPIHAFRPEKDMTDTDIAVKRALADGADEILFLGTTGTRLDHVLSNIYNLSLLAAQGIRACMVDAHNRITVPAGKTYAIAKEAQFGTYVSFLALGGPVEGITLKGFKYPVTDGRIVCGDGGLFVSNEITAEEGQISWSSGNLIVIESRD